MTQACSGPMCLHLFSDISLKLGLWDLKDDHRNQHSYFYLNKIGLLQEKKPGKTLELL